MGPTSLTIGILLIGVVVVIGGILGLRLHAFLALILGALIVGALTPTSAVKRHALQSRAMPFLEGNESQPGRIILDVSQAETAPMAGTPLLILRRQKETNRYDQVGRARIQEIIDGEDQAPTARAVLETQGLTLQPNDLVLTQSDYQAALSLARQTVAERVASGFGTTCAEIGILIAMASIIGKCLLDSGAADRVVRSTLRRLGERGAPFSFLSSGFLLGIPVFFDTVFYLMIPLGKAMRMRTGRNYLLYVLTIVAGATMAHSLVPPTPGPLFVAETIGVDLGVMILGGLIVGAFTAAFGYLYATFSNLRWTLPLRESPEFSLKDLEEIAHRDESRLPPLALALAPIVLPVLLIAGNTILQRYSALLPTQITSLSATLGDKNIALVLSAGIAMIMLGWQKRSSLSELAQSTQAALAGGGVIILITAAGGAFGMILQQTGVAGLISDLPSASPMVIVLLAFLITTAIRTAQGSATVAMITAVGVLSGIASAGQLGFHPVYLALAIGCGSKPIGWMNDSGFWVITKMSGMSEAEGLKYVTIMTSLMGVVGLIVLLIGVSLFPLV